MARKVRIGIRCYDTYVPNEVWAMFKVEVRKMFKVAFPDEKFSISEFYWQGFSTENEYIRITPKNTAFSDWGKVWKVLNFFAHEFGMTINFVYQKIPYFEALKNDTLFKRDDSNYSLKGIKSWTEAELDKFLANYSFEEIKSKYSEVSF